jgi:hypothetical protein
MFIPKAKLPKLLKHALELPNITRLSFKYTSLKIENNEIRLWYKSQAPRVKYYNPHMMVELLQLKEEIIPHVDVYSGD